MREISVGDHTYDPVKGIVHTTMTSISSSKEGGMFVVSGPEQMEDGNWKLVIGVSANETVPSELSTQFGQIDEDVQHQLEEGFGQLTEGREY